MNWWPEAARLPRDTLIANRRRFELDMSPRRSILRELSAAGPDGFKRPSEISGFGRQAPKYREAVNGLLRDQLISGSKDQDGNLIIGLNTQRLPQIRKELRPWFAVPTTWGVALLVAVLGAAALLI